VQRTVAVPEDASALTAVAATTGIISGELATMRMLVPSSTAVFPAVFTKISTSVLMRRN
jgi:hypothetical protein